MDEGDINEDFAGSTANPHHAEARERWGHTAAYRQSEERVRKMTKADMESVQKESEALIGEIVDVMDRDIAGPEVQTLIARHYAHLRNFYEPSPELYRGLADMYVSDARFAAYYEKHADGLAEFMRLAMHCYASSLENTVA